MRNAPGTAPKASRDHLCEWCPQCLLPGQVPGVLDGSDPGTAFKELPGLRPEKPRLGKKNFVCSMHSPWKMTAEVGQGGREARTTRKPPAGGTARAALAATQRQHRSWQQRSMEPHMGLSSATYQLCDPRCSSTSLSLNYPICKMEII